MPSDTIGRVSVPLPTDSGLTFPLVSEYGYGMSRDWEIIEHRFGSRATLSTQRFSTGSGARKFYFKKGALSLQDRANLLSFYDSVQGSFQTFLYHQPNPDRSTTTTYKVIFEIAPLSIQHLVTMCQVGITFVEIIDPAAAPSYSVSTVCLRFPSSTLAADLLSQTQQLIPLLHVKVKDSAVPDIYFSDRRVTVGSHLYLPRLTGMGEPGSDVIMSQDISGSADNVRFTLGNADRAMSALVKDTSLLFATVELSLFHINTGTLLQLWKGIVLNWGLDGTATFSLFCSDGLYPITQQYPPRTLTRQCWKTFDDGVNCPFGSAGAHGGTLAALGGSATSCDFFFNSPNGCLAHGMSPYFGGHPAFPQSVSIKDNGTGVLNFGRDIVTSTSIVSDSIWGLPLPEIWCNDHSDPKRAFWANAIVAAVRDESDFEDVLGIIGVGPIGLYEGMSVQTTSDGYKFVVSPMADGFLPQGFKVDGQLVITGYQPQLGLREVKGNNPADTTTDVFSLGQGTPQRWDVPDPVFANIITGVAGDILPFAAGTAFVELRYNKATTKGGISPTTAESHTMSVPIARGLTGVTYDAADSQSVVSGLVNPFWVAVNTYLRALGLDKADSLVQLDHFVRSSVFVGNGTGCAEIADLSVPKIVGSGNETQFEFQGTLTEFKPFRDWLTEILACALGYYTFEFGRLKLGIRENAGAVSAFTIGNMLFQSLSLSPASPQFEYLKIDFANVDLQNQNDMAEYQDKDHAKYFGRAGAPLTSRQRSVGTSTLSQALRIAATRVREEIGGVLRPDQSNPYIEWDNNLTATFRTTVLALDTEVGQVISITHPDIPTYPGKVGGAASPANTWNFRIIKWSLHKDWSISITAKSVTDSMYDLEVGPKPTSVTPPSLPVLFYAEPLGHWAPYQIQADAADAIFPSEYTFDVSLSYSTAENGSPLAQAIVTGKLPLNQFIPNCGAPDVKRGTIGIANSGGALDAGTTYYVQICATDSSGRHSAPSDILIVQIPAGTNTNRILLDKIGWPAVSGLTGYVVFASDAETLICSQQSGSLSGSVGSYTPTQINITGPFARSTYGVPNSDLASLTIKARRLIHGGVLGASITAVSSTVITAAGAADLTSADNWAGRVLGIIGRTTGSVPFQHFNITSYNPATGDFTVDRNPVSAGILEEDVMVVCFQGYDNSSNPYIISDSGLMNATNGHVGESISDPFRIGNYVLVIAGTSRGQSARIVDNTHIAYTLADPLVIDATSIWIVVTASWEYSQSVSVANGDPTKPTQVGLNVNNYAKLPIVIEGVTLNSAGVEITESGAPIRMLWVFGSQGERVVTADTTVLPTDGLLSVDTAIPTNAAGSDTLGAAITSTSATSVTFTSGTTVVNGTIIQIGTEKIRVVSGTGATRTVERGALGSTAATHANGDPVTVPGYIVVTCLSSDQVFNQVLFLRKTSSDINYVVVMLGGTDTFADGGTTSIIPDNTDANGTMMLKFPGV